MTISADIYVFSPFTIIHQPVCEFATQSIIAVIDAHCIAKHTTSGDAIGTI